MNAVPLASSVQSRPQPAAMASAHAMVSRLLDGARGRLARAEYELVSGGGPALEGAAAIVAALQDSLDMDLGGQLAANLFDLYDYMLRRLAEAARTADAGILREVASLLETIQDGWEAIAPDMFGAD